MSNPFKYGVVVSGNDFADREKELKELVGKLKENVRVFLVAPRRYGRRNSDPLSSQSLLGLGKVSPLPP